MYGLRNADGLYLLTCKAWGIPDEMYGVQRFKNAMHAYKHACKLRLPQAELVPIGKIA
jgi:hypothetical protein